jgi:formate hydrogenlyase subunit 3/multisubunit Na+/H+ antiporter MnhD subunit
MDSFLFRAIFCFAFGATVAVWSVFMIFFARHHARFTEAENAWWVRRGLVSAQAAPRIARFERSMTFKVICVILAIACLLFGFRYLAMHERVQSFRRLHAVAPVDQSPNQALERTADRRVDLLLMTSTLRRKAQVAVVSGRSSCSR